MSSTESTAFFSGTWSLYDLITKHNYMFHREIYEKISDVLKLRKGLPYRLLDLGCGNVRYLAPCLTQFPPSTYQGVDLSEAALAEARETLSELRCPIALKHGDLLEAIELTEKKWDVVFSGFAIHHLSAEEKQRFFNAVAECLTEQGWMLMVDVVREANQSREEYLAAYLQFMRNCWVEIPSEQLEEACAHVKTHDYPEYLAALKEMAKASGLENMQLVSQYGSHYTILFSRLAIDELSQSIC